MFKKFVVFILFFCICCSSTTICNCYATDMTFTKLATDTDADFSDDKILVVLDNESSLKFKDYSESDFGSIACTNVTKLTKHSEVAAKLAVDNIVRHVTQGEPLREINSQVSNFNQILCLEISNPGKSNIIKAVNKLNKMDNILVACPNFKITSFQTSNDPHSLDYQPESVDYVDYLESIELYKAWDITVGSSNVTVGVLDSGISEHPDLNGNLRTDLFANCITSVPGAVAAVPYDNCGHGTSVAGIIGAVGNNNIGLSGICWDVSLVSIKVTDENGEGYTYDLVEGIEYAISKNIDILNISLGTPDELSDSEAIYSQTLFNAAISNYNGLAVCAAGNEGVNNDDRAEFLLNESNNVIYVGASTSLDGKLSSSNHGIKSVDLFAPGQAVLSTMSLDVCPDDYRHDTMFAPHYNQEDVGYHLFSETSFATPFVSGVAALMLSINPNLSTAQLKDILLRSVDVKDGLKPYCLTGGRLNAYKAVSTSSNLRFDYRYSYNSLDDYTHGVICDTCECSCRNDDYSCGSGCDFGCDPCEECHLYYTELHYWTYWIIQGNVLYHTARCRDCGYSKMTAHNWVSSGSVYVCTLCEMTSTYAPTIPAALPPVNDEQDLIE